VPSEIRCDEFQVRLLASNDLAKHYEAQISSIQHLREALEYRDQPWLRSGMTMRTAFAELCHCAWQHHNRLSFTYGVFDLANERELGCVYIEPTGKQGSDAQTVTWVRSSELSTGFDETLFEFTQRWLESDWPLRAVAHPGRVDDWSECQQTAFVPTNFIVPNGVPFQNYVLKLLRTEHLLLDFNAYMANVDHIRSLSTYTHDWPSEHISLEFALIDLGMCEWQHEQQRDMFSYGVFNHEESEELGCLYLTRGEGDHDATVESWIAKEHTDQGLAGALTEFGHDWLATDWPFRHPKFSGMVS